MDTKAKILDYLRRRCSGTPQRVPLAELQSQVGTSQQNIQRHLRCLEQEGLIVKPAYGTYTVPTKPKKSWVTTVFSAICLLWSKLNPVETKLNPIESKLNPVESKLNPVESKLNPVESKLNPVESKLNPVESKLNPPPLSLNIKKKTKTKENKKCVIWDVVGIENAFVRAGPPADTDALETFVNWDHPHALHEQQFVESLFWTNEPGWSRSLTRRIIFGRLARLHGFERSNLTRIAAEAKSGNKIFKNCEEAVSSIPEKAGMKMKGYQRTWHFVASQIKLYLEGEYCIAWKPPVREQQKTKGLLCSTLKK